MAIGLFFWALLCAAGAEERAALRSERRYCLPHVLRQPPLLHYAGLVRGAVLARDSASSPRRAYPCLILAYTGEKKAPRGRSVGPAIEGVGAGVSHNAASAVALVPILTLGIPFSARPRDVGGLPEWGISRAAVFEKNPIFVCG